MTTAMLRMQAVRLPGLVREHWIASIVLLVAAALYLVAGMSLFSLTGPNGASAKVPQVSATKLVEAPPAPEPLQFKAVDPEDAVAINSAVPISTLPNPAARAFLLRAASAGDTARALECLTAAVYYEAATEPVDGQRAVAQVVLNRVRHPAYPDSVCGVVFQGSERATGCQFTFTCDGSLARAPVPGIWSRAKDIARAALAGYVYKPVGWATHYHTNWVVPYWSSSLVKLANVGTHIFYRWEGGWGRPGAFTGRHAGAEPTAAKMHYLGFGSPPEETLTPEQQAALAAGELPPGEIAGEGAAALPPSTYDPGKLNRAIVRRFQPVKREDVATVIAKQAKPGETVSDAYRWAMTGGAAPADALGKKTATSASPAPPPVEAGAR
jgi:spore germination cell wall hydrolase CwlJ-like protein